MQLHDGFREHTVALALVDPRVVAGDEADAGGMRCRERVAPALEGHPEPGEHLEDPGLQHGVERLPQCGAYDDVLLAEAGHQVGREVEAVRTDARAVLDAIGTRHDRLLDRRDRVRMHGDREVAGMRLVDDELELFERELAFGDVGTRRHVAATRHDLDQIDLPFVALGDRGAQRVRASGLAAHHPAVATDGGDRRARGDDVRFDGTDRPAVAALDHGPLVVAEVADRRDSRRELLAQTRCR